MITKNIIFFLLIACSNFMTCMHKNPTLAATIINYERFQHLAELRQTLTINQYQKTNIPYYKVESPCNCIQNGNYKNIGMAHAIKNTINTPSLQLRKITTQQTLKQIKSEQNNNFENFNQNTIQNYYNYYSLYQHNLEFLTQENEELRHAHDLLSHVQACDAATTIACLARKKIAKNKVAKMCAEKIAIEQFQRDQKNQEQVTMSTEERRTKKVIAYEKEQAQLRVQQEQADEKLRLTRAKKEAQKQKELEIKTRRAAEKQAEEDLKKQKQKQLSLQQKAAAQAKKEQELLRKKIQQEKEAADLALLTNMAQWQSQIIIKDNKNETIDQKLIRSKEIATSANLSPFIEQEQTEHDDSLQTIILSNLSAASIDNNDDDPIDWLEKRNEIMKQIKEIEIPTHDKNKAHEVLLAQQRLQFQEKTIQTVTDLHESCMEFHNFSAWQEQQKVLKLKREEEKEEQRKKNLKILLKTKESQRQKKKDELAKKLDDDFAYTSETEKVLIELLESYNKLLATQATIDSFKQMEAIFIESEDRLRMQNESLKWYLASHPELYQSIKEKYLSLQRNINDADREIILKKFEKIVQANSNKNLSQQEFESLGTDYKKISPKLSQVQILRKLESIHRNKGVLDISKFLHPNQPVIDIDSLGILSPSILEQAEAEIKARILPNKHIQNFHQITPLVESLLRKINLEPLCITINCMINSAAEITLIQQPEKISSDFFTEIKRSVFVTLQRENELVLEPHTIDQMADISKIHCSIIKAFMDAKKENS
jgi:hypothetical protein